MVSKVAYPGITVRIQHTVIKPIINTIQHVCCSLQTLDNYKAFINVGLHVLQIIVRQSLLQ